MKLPMGEPYLLFLVTFAFYLNCLNLIVRDLQTILLYRDFAVVQLFNSDGWH